MRYVWYCANNKDMCIRIVFVMRYSHTMEISALNMFRISKTSL